MSYAYNQRKKTIRRFKKKHGREWFMPFREYVEALVRRRAGPFVTLEDLFAEQKKANTPL